MVRFTITGGGAVLGAVVAVLLVAVVLGAVEAVLGTVVGVDIFTCFYAFLREVFFLEFFFF